MLKLIILFYYYISSLMWLIFNEFSIKSCVVILGDEKSPSKTQINKPIDEGNSFVEYFVSIK